MSGRHEDFDSGTRSSGQDSSLNPASDFGIEHNSQNQDGLADIAMDSADASLANGSGPSREEFLDKLENQLFTARGLDPGNAVDAQKLTDFQQRNAAWQPGRPLFLRGKADPPPHAEHMQRNEDNELLDHEYLTEPLNADPKKLGSIAILTVQPSSSENYLVWNGQPSSNGTRVLTSSQSKKIIEDVTLKEGDTIEIGRKTRVRIQGEQHRVTTDLEYRIRTLDIGQSIIIGRHPSPNSEELPVPDRIPKHEFDGSVSRHHCTLTRVEDGIDKFGNRQRLYQLSDGVKGEKRIFVDTPDGEWEEVHGRQVLSPGRKIMVGENGPVFEAPDPFKDFNFTQFIGGEVDSQSDIGSQSIVESISDFTVSRGGVGSQSVTFRAPRDLLGRGGDLDIPQIQALGVHIKQGLDLIKNAQYSAARAHFEQTEVLEDCGFRFEQGNWFGLVTREVTGKAVARLLSDIASRSWFKPGSRTVMPSFGTIQKGDPNRGFADIRSGDSLEHSIVHSVSPIDADMSIIEERVDFTRGVSVQNLKDELQNQLRGTQEAANFRLTPEERQKIKDFDREVCLIYAEEWTHAYQHAFGGPVSKKGELLKNLPTQLRDSVHEHDVRELFGEQAVPMSPMYKERYGRETVHTALKNYAGKDEQNAIRGLLATSEIDSPVVIGKKPNPRADGTAIALRKQSGENLPATVRLSRNQFFDEQIADIHLQITPRGAGEYEVMPLQPDRPDGKVFFKDEFDIWRPVPEATELKAGTRIRMGIAFEFKLP